MRVIWLCQMCRADSLRPVAIGIRAPGKPAFRDEQNQLKDGSVKVPEVLQKYLGGLEVITKKK